LPEQVFNFVSFSVIERDFFYADIHQDRRQGDDFIV
jgi:hypothetical protein